MADQPNHHQGGSNRQSKRGSAVSGARSPIRTRSWVRQHAAQSASEHPPLTSDIKVTDQPIVHKSSISPALFSGPALLQSIHPEVAPVKRPRGRPRKVLIPETPTTTVKESTFNEQPLVEASEFGNITKSKKRKSSAASNSEESFSKTHNPEIKPNHLNSKHDKNSEKDTLLDLSRVDFDQHSHSLVNSSTFVTSNQKSQQPIRKKRSNKIALSNSTSTLINNFEHCNSDNLTVPDNSEIVTSKSVCQISLVKKQQTKKKGVLYLLLQRLLADGKKEAISCKLAARVW